MRISGVMLDNMQRKRLPRGAISNDACRRREAAVCQLAVKGQTQAISGVPTTTTMIDSGSPNRQ